MLGDTATLAATVREPLPKGRWTPQAGPRRHAGGPYRSVLRDAASMMGIEISAIPAGYSRAMWLPSSCDASD